SDVIKMNSLTRLNNIEESVVESVNTAGKALALLSKSMDLKGGATTDQPLKEFKQLSDKYFTIVESEVHKPLMEFVDSMTDVAPFEHSSYTSKYELDLTHNFTELILLHLEDMENILKEN
ncbi:hypothetical protein SAMD00019534_022520, partial [Acytostelium subglobosum LB1]|uniref:hypothetical protein n=1 Tax=Acytostelium subglobosum LB1 TaxID=1410327 RepID=UPI000644C428